VGVVEMLLEKMDFPPDILNSFQQVKDKVEVKTNQRYLKYLYSGFPFSRE